MRSLYVSVNQVYSMNISQNCHFPTLSRDHQEIHICDLWFCGWDLTALECNKLIVNEKYQ